MALAVIFSEKKEYTKGDPLKIQVDEGVHEILGGGGLMHVTCSHITFVGKGKDQTTVRGGFEVTNQQNVKFEELTITNQSGNGLELKGSETNVDVLKCVVKKCGATGLLVGGGATVTATQCEFMENDSWGVCVKMQIQKQDLPIARSTTMEIMVCVHMVMLSWIFVVQKRTSTPTNVVVFVQTVVAK